MDDPGIGRGAPDDRAAEGPTAPSVGRRGRRDGWARRSALGVAVVALAGTATLAGARLAGPVSGHPVQIVAFVPAGALLAVVAAVLGALVPRTRRRRLLLAAPAAALLALHACWQAPLLLGAVPRSTPGCSLRVLTLNAQKADSTQLTVEIAAIAPDVVILLQSAPPLLHAVADANPRFTSVFGLYDVDAEEVVVMSALPVRAADWVKDGRIGRADVVSPCLGAVDVVGVHPTAPHPDSSWDRDHAELTAYLGATFGPALAAGGARVVVAGDFNATLDHVQLRRTLDLGLRDAFELTNAGWVPTYPAAGTTSWHRLPVPTFAAIDHVLVADGLAVAYVHTVDLAGADHLGILATLGAVAR